MYASSLVSLNLGNKTGVGVVKQRDRAGGRWTADAGGQCKL